MNINFPWRKKSTREAAGPAINKTNYKNFVVKAIGFIASQGAARGEFSESEYNLAEIRAASEGDSYIKIALMKYSYLMYKAGYTLRSENDAAADYVRMRFRIMSFATQKPMDILFQEIADDLVRFSNAFLIKSRVDKLMPGVNAKGVYSDKPIGGYFRADPATMKIKRDKFGTVLSYSQTIEGEGEKKFAPTEVIHFYLDRDSNNAFGTPRITAALEDVKLLRRIEGNVVSLIYRFAIPIYQWIIGLPEVGFQATDKEITEAQKEIENMPMDGVIVTNEKTAIKAIGAEGSALDASSYLNYFERRVFTALSVSESQMGRGGAKSDADSMEAQAHDTVKHIQRTLSTFIQELMVNELLLEGGFNPIINESDIVEYVFEETSLETKIKVENHELLKYQSNMTPFDEARKNIGKKAEVDESQLYFNKVETKSAIDQIKAKTEGSLEVAKAASQNKAASGAGVAGNGTTASAKPNKAVTNNNRPKNQYGTTSVKVKEGQEELDLDETPDLEIAEELSIEEKTIRNVQRHKKVFTSVYKRYQTLRNDIADTDSDLDLLFSAGKDTILADLRTHIQMRSHEGISKAVTDISRNKGAHHLIPNVNVPLSQFYEEASSTLNGILKDINKRIKASNRDPVQVNAIFAGLEYRLRFMIEFILPKVYWFSYVKTGAYYGIDKAYIIFDGSKDKDEHPSEIDTNNFSIDEIPAYHSFCDCKVSFKAGDKD